MQEGKTRILAVAFIKHDNKILVCPGYDDKKKEKFYRLLGGGVDFGEKALDTLRREFREELNVKLKNIKQVSVLENIFTYNGKKGHEICFIFKADFSDKENYKKNSFKILDVKGDDPAVWIELNFENAKKIYPKGAVKI